MRVDALLVMVPTQPRMPPTQFAGSVRRPVLSVVNATRRPLPSAAMMFLFGTLTLSNEMTALASALTS